MIGYEVRDGVAVVTIDNPPVNALGPGVLDGIEAAVARGDGDPAVRALVLVGAGATFVAGADINMFTRIATREQSLDQSRAFHTSLRRIEDTSKPLVAALHGHTLGGGLELAMACHYRIATRSAYVGQPEVLLGLIPGAGGTQRLPRLCGAALALEMCVEGGRVSAAAAHATGIVDQLVDGDREALVSTAIAVAREHAAAGPVRRTRERADRLADMDAARAAVSEWRARLARTSTPVPAPRAAVDAVEAACRLDFDAGSRLECERFADCLLSTESRALVHLFFAEREVTKVAGVSKATPSRDIRRAAVLGAGTMGSGIAMAYANAGIPVLLKDTDAAALARGVAAIRARYEASVAKGRLKADALERTLALITPTASFDGFDAVDIVVEAVFEDMAVKRAVFTDLGRVTSPDCLLASNTSTLDIDEFARASSRAPNVVGHHFFSPAHVMKLVEIVRGRETSAETLATSQRLVRRLGKVGVVVGNAFGFVANRMLAHYLREAHLLLEEGASVAQIDRALISFGLPVGPFGLQDIAGIDVGARIRQHLRATGQLPGEGPQSEIPDRLFAMGRYGQKTGAGWYRYEAGSRTPIEDPLVETLAREAAARRQIVRRAIDDDEIVARVMTALANEGARILDDGLASRASDIDVIYCEGFGFPRYRGGPMFYADTVGLATVRARVLDYRTRLGDHWRLAPAIDRLAAEGRGFFAPATPG